MESADLWKPQCRFLDHISELSKSSSEDLVPLSELESTYNGSPGGENFAFSGSESHLGSQSR